MFERRSSAGVTVSIAIGQVASENGHASGNGTAAKGARITTTRFFGPSETAAIRPHLRDAGVDLLIRFVPSDEAICRLSPLPEAVGQDRAAVADALGLIAETDLPAHLRWFRRAAGLVRLPAIAAEGSTETPRPRLFALLAGWHTRSGGGSLGGPLESVESAFEGLPQLWTVEAVALATMLAPTGPYAADSRPWLASVDPSAGAACVLAAGEASPRVRSIRVENSEPSVWQEYLTAAVNETLGLEPEDSIELPSDTTGPLLISRGVEPVIAGEKRDVRWLSQFGMAAAALDAFADPDPATRALFNLHAIEPREKAPIVQRMATWFSSPGRAIGAVAACAIILLGARLGVAYARHETVKKQIGDASEIEKRLEEQERLVAFYSTLKEKRWPMTKLLADVAGAAPVGIELEMLEITQGDNLIVRGTAETNTLVTQFRQNLDATSVFEGVTIPNTGSSDNGVQFSLQAKVRPTGVFLAAKPADDFASNPLGKRLFGDEWTSGSETRASSPRPSHREPASTDSRRSGSEERGRDTRSSASRSSVPSATPAEAPAPLSDEQIAKLDRTKAMMEFATRKKAAGQATDPAVKQRLLDESEKARKRMAEAGGGGS